MITTDPRLLAAAAALRHEVFVVAQAVPPEIEADGADAAAIHAVVQEGDQVVGTGRLLEAVDEHGPHARLGRIAVREDVRGHGLGVRVVGDLERAAAVAGLPRMRLHAQDSVVGFYERLGWRVVGEPDTEAGIAHRWMERDLLPGLRAAADSDADPVQALIGGCFAEFPPCALELDGLDAWMRAPASGYRAKGGMLLVVPANGGGLAASVGWQPGADADTLGLASLYVVARCRRRGYATALVGVVERHARRRGATKVVLWTDTRFRDAHRLYERLGYVRHTQTRELADASGSVEYGYTKEL